MPVTRFSLSNLLDLSDLQHEAVLYLACVAGFPFHSPSSGHSDPQPAAPARSGLPGWHAVLSRRWLDGVQAVRRVP
jgi:hypothetical protein